MRRNIICLYLEWHFWDVPKAILAAWKNFLRFNLNYWSLPLLVRTLFSHWRRYRYSYGRGFDFKRYFEAFTFNMMSRGIGAIMRFFLITIGLISEIFVLLAGAIVFLGWLILPALLVLGLIFGFKIMF